MNRDEIVELAAGYALGGLEGEDRLRFEALLQAGNPDAVGALREFQETLTGLAEDFREPPPPGVKTALMERIATASRVDQMIGAATSITTRERPRRSVWPAVLTGTMAAGVAAMVAGLLVSAGYQQRLEGLQREAAALRTELDRQQAILGILRDPTTQVVALEGLKPSPEAKGRVMWHEKAGGLFVASGLPPVQEGKTYQLWAIAGKSPPVPAGVFSVDPGGTGSLRVPPLPGVSRVDVFAVTLEPAGGLPAPSGEMYLAGKS
jgi:anti-sigma-K factor RskA